MISKSFLKSSIIYTIGGAMPMVSSILLLPFYANMLEPGLFVALSFYISISEFLRIFFTYSLDTYFGIKYTHLSDDPQEQKKFLGTTGGLLLFLGASITLISLATGPFLFPLIFPPKANVTFGVYAIASVLTAFFNSYFKTASNCLIYLKSPKPFMIFSLINFIATIGISIAGLYLFPGSLAGPISGRFFSGLIIFFLGLYVFKGGNGFIPQKKYLKDILAFCTPYLFFVLSLWVVSNIDRYFLVSFIDSVSLAGYDQLLKCFIGVEFFQNSISAIIFPKVFELWKKHGKNETTPETNRYFNVFTAINILFQILFCLLIPVFIVAFIHRPEYYFGFDFLGLICAGYATRSILNYYLASILYSRSTSTLLKIFGLSSLFQIGVTYVCIYFFGLIGAVFASVLTKIMQVLFSMLFTRSLFSYHFNNIKIFGIPLLFILVNVICFFIYPRFSYTQYAIELAVFGIIFYLVFRKEIVTVIRQYLTPSGK
jgi:O-antigen/teichoic acid export membrane protein